MNQNHSDFGKKILPKCLFAIAVLLFAVFFIAPAAADDDITISGLQELYYIGEDISITVTNSTSDPLYFYLIGTNLGHFAGYIEFNPTTITPDNGQWKVIFDGSLFSRIDPGQYTLSISTKPKVNSLDELNTGVYTQGTFSLTQPIMQAGDVPASIDVGTAYTINGLAAGADKIHYYVFANNFFDQGKVDVNSNNEFIITTKTLDSAGQYFVILQHPMYDEKFNIWVDNDKKVYSSYDESEPKFEFDIAEKQTANAVLSLVELFNNRAQDDKYILLAFEVTGTSSTSPSVEINPLPSTITKGDTLTVSGDTNLGSGVSVTVEIISTACISIPKDIIDSDSFASYTTQTDSEGKWSCTIDTSNLKGDIYFVIVSIESLEKNYGEIAIIDNSASPDESPDDSISNSNAYRNVVITPSAALTEGNTVSGSFTVMLPAYTINDIGTFSFTSPLENMGWEITVVDEIYGNELATITEKNTPISQFRFPMFNVYYPKQDITLKVSFEGTVPLQTVESSINVFTVKCTNTEIGSYQSPKQAVYKPANLNEDITRIKTKITSTEERINTYSSFGIDTTSALQQIESAKTKISAAENAGSANVQTAYENMEAAEENIKNAERSLATVGLPAVTENIEIIDSASDTLYDRGWSYEAQHLEVKVTSLSYSRDSLKEICDKGGIPDTEKLDKLVSESFAVKETAERYLNSDTATSLPTTISLKVGWNFISIPSYLDVSQDTAKELFGNVDTAGLGILTYNTKTGWDTLKETTPINPLEGYWVYAKTPATLTLIYSTEINTPPAKSVSKGWNAVGLSAEKAMTAKSAFAGLNWGRYLPWNIDTGNWDNVIVNGGSIENSEEHLIYLTEAGWLYVNEEGIYVGNTA